MRELQKHLDRVRRGEASTAEMQAMDRLVIAALHSRGSA